MAKYDVRYVHKISPSDRDKLPAPVDVGSADLADRRTLGRALRASKVLGKGERIDHFRVEHNGRIVVFPQASIWWSIILTPVCA